jgi:hypothetical protein
MALTLNRRRFGALAVIAVALLAAPAGAQTYNFSPTNLVVLRVAGTANYGPGSGALAAASTAVFLDQFLPNVPSQTSPVDTTGVLGAPSIALPIVAGTSGSPLAVTVSGSATSEGYISRTADGFGIVVPGYNAAPGVASVNNTAPGTVNRSIGIITAGGMNTSNGFSNGPSGSFRSATALTPTGPIWVSTPGSATAPGVLLHSNNGTVQVAATITNGNTRNLAIYGNTLFTSSGASGAPGFGVSMVGSAGIPPTLEIGSNNLPGTNASGSGNPSPLGFVLFNNPLNPNSYETTGLNTLYMADDRSVANGGGVQRWVFNGTTWNLTGTFTNGGANSYRGLTASINGTTVTLFATTSTASGNQLVTFQDALTAAGGTFDASSVVLATAPTNTVFRGVAFAPVPEPATVLGIAAGALGLGGWLRRRLGHPEARSRASLSG